MRYRIEYVDGRYCSFANGRKDLIKRIKQMKGGTIKDIQKLHKNGYSETVMEKYEKYIKS